MSDLRTRILHALINNTPPKYLAMPQDLSDLTTAIIYELGKRLCERCRQPKWLTEFPEPHEGSDVMRPFCIPCTDYVEWATS